jgi:uncharacterized protein (TIGR00369 family)
MHRFDGTLFGKENACFGCGPTHAIGFRVQVEKQSDDSVRALFVPGEQFQSAPGIMHGGLVTTLADEVGAWALVACLDRFGFTTQLSARFIKPVRIGVEAAVDARLIKVGSRLVRVEVAVSQSALCASFEMTFAVLEQNSAEAMLGAPLPEAWLRFCRRSSDS